MPDKTTVGQRFAQFIAYLGISKNAFAASLDKTATVIQHLVDERNKPGFDLLCKVFEVYPSLSKDWLLQGNGPMIVEESATSSSESGSVENIPAKSAPSKEKPPVAAATAPAAVSIAKPADASLPKASVVSEPVASSSASEPAPNAAASQPLSPGMSAAIAPAAAHAASVDNSWQTALYTQQMAHQLAMAELRNQHLQEQQRLMQQMLDMMRKAV